MAKYTIYHNCGHSQEHDVFDAYRDANQVIMGLEKQDCLKCWADKNREKTNFKGRFSKPKTDFKSLRSN